MKIVRVVICILILCLPLSAITIGTMVSSSTTASATLTFSVTLAAGDQLVVVHGNRGAFNVTGVTYNGVAMTNAVLINNMTASNLGCGVWYSLTPSTGANNVVITASGALDWLVGSAFPIQSMKTSAPVDDTDSVSGSAADPEPLTGLTTTTDGDAVFDCMATNAGPFGVTMTAETNRTLKMDFPEICPSGCPVTNDESHGSAINPKSPAGSVSMAWAGFPGANIAHAGAAFLPATGTFPPPLMVQRRRRDRESFTRFSLF